MNKELEELRKALDELEDALATRQLARQHLKSSRQELASMQDDLETLYAILKKEEADVNKIEAMSVNALFRHFLKNAEEQYEIEHQEYVVAALRYNECLDAIRMLEYEIGVLEASLENEKELEKRRENLLIKKELLVKELFPDVASRIKSLDYRITLRKVEINEINEALKAGSNAHVKLLEINKLVEKVTHWGQWGHNEYMSHYSKSSFIDRARKLAVEAKHELSRFEKEVKDVFLNLNVKNDLTLDAFEQFLGIFYDNMITDWIVQSNLRHTQNSLAGTTAKIQRLLASLKHEKKLLEDAISDFEKQKYNLIRSKA